jgi:1-acyl-sn-glycerol-3-phosphate acyltransferase
MAKENIYEKNLAYSFLKTLWVDWKVKHSYHKTEVVGKENIPTDGAVIICANHCNTLMDALVILRSTYEKKVFGARADIFKKKFIAKLMYFFRILPMVRKRDCLRNVLQNNDTQEIIVRTLEHNVPFILFPEGSHRTKHSLQQLGKGAFRIALAANEKFGGEKPVYILPAGIEYGDYFRYRGTSLVTFGKPINVTEFLKEGAFENEPQAIEALRKLLAGKMSELITFLPDDENYESKWALLKMCAIKGEKKGYGDFGTSLYKSMLKNRKIAGEIKELEAKDPEKASELYERAGQFEKKRKEEGISIYSFRKCSLKVQIAGKTFAALVGLPYFIFSSIVSLPMWALEAKIRSGIKDPAFGNTVSLGIKLVLHTILSLIYIPLAFCLTRWWIALILVALWLPSFSYFHDYLEGCRRWISDINLLKHKSLYKEFKSIVKEFNKSK